MARRRRNRRRKNNSFGVGSTLGFASGTLQVVEGFIGSQPIDAALSGDFMGAAQAAVTNLRQGMYFPSVAGGITTGLLTEGTKRVLNGLRMNPRIRFGSVTVKMF